MRDMKIKVLKGLPASGKSTYARKLVLGSGNFGRVNRDELRETVFAGKWTREREKIIMQIEKAIAQVLVQNNHSVVVDDTNFRDVWKDWHNNAVTLSDLELVLETQMFDTSLEECIRRDKERATKGLPSVGQNVITKMALRNDLIAFPDLPIVLVDIDGTLAASTGRERHLKGEKKDWKSYYSLLGTDAPHTHIFKWVAELSKDHTIIIVSGRGAEYQEATREWFEKVWSPNPLFPELEVPKFPVFLWLFRDAGDRREDSIVKSEFLNLLPKPPELILDDRPQVVRMWRSKGLKVIPVAGECEEF